MKIRKPNKAKIMQEAEISLGIMAGVKSFGKCGAHMVTPKKWVNGKTNLTVLAISAMLVLSYFTMSYQGLAFATIGGGRGGGGSNFDRGDGGGSNFDRGDGGGSNFDRGDGGGDGGNSGGLPNINDDFDDDFDISHNYDIDDDLNIDDDFDIDHYDDHYTKTVVVHDSDNTEQTIIVNTNLQGTCFVTQSQVEDIPGIMEQLSNQCTSVTILQG